MAHPQMYDDSNPAIKHPREVCLPQALEAREEGTFRVTGGSMFAMTGNNHHNSRHVAVWVKAPPMVQEILVKSDSRRFSVPPYVGPKGWVGARLDSKVNWDELAGILKDGYLMSAPRKLGGRVRSAMTKAASMSDVATKRRRISLSKIMPKSKGDARSGTRSRSKRTTGVRCNEVR
jgi:predicted DNA-binding protein (MmcQ/YjbR family)